jgi:hypothetical protein
MTRSEKCIFLLLYRKLKPVLSSVKGVCLYFATWGTSVWERETVWDSNESVVNSKRAGIHNLKINMPRSDTAREHRGKGPFLCTA